MLLADACEWQGQSMLLPGTEHGIKQANLLLSLCAVSARQMLRWQMVLLAIR